MRYVLIITIIIGAFSGCKSPTSTSLPTVNGQWAGWGVSSYPDTITDEQDSVIAVMTGADSCTLTMNEDNSGTVTGTAVIQFYNISVNGQDTTWHRFVYSATTVTGTDIYPTVSFTTSVPYEAVRIPLDYTGKFKNGDLIEGVLSDRNGNSVAMNLARTK